MDRDTILRSIEPKSDQLNADDLIAGPIDVVVEDVRKGNVEQPIVVLLEGGHRPWKPCKSMRRLLVKLWGDVPANWIGQRLRLFCDPSVSWAGMQVGGIRVSHASGIQSRTSVMLTTTRGKRSEYIVDPMPAEKSKPAKSAKYIEGRVQGCIEALNKAGSVDELSKLMPHVDALLADCNDEQRVRIEVAMSEARTVLEGE